jgi:hypothetical protein
MTMENLRWIISFQCSNPQVGWWWSSPLNFTFNFKWVLKIGSFTWFKSSPFMTNPLIPSNLQGIWQVEQPRGNAKSTGLLRMPDWKAQLLRIRSFWITGGSWNQQKLGETAGSDGDLKKTSTWLPLVNRRLFQRTVMDPRTSDPTGPKSHGPKRIGFCCWWSDDRWKKTPVKWSSWNYPAR